MLWMQRLPVLALAALAAAPAAPVSSGRFPLTLPNGVTWDFDILKVEIGPQEVPPGGRIPVTVTVAARKLGDGTGRIQVKALLSQRGGLLPLAQDEQSLDLRPEGATQTVHLALQAPNRPGEYLVDAEIHGGAFYGWRFDTTADGHYAFPRTIQVRAGASPRAGAGERAATPEARRETRRKFYNLLEQSLGGLDLQVLIESLKGKTLEGLLKAFSAPLSGAGPDAAGLLGTVADLSRQSFQALNVGSIQFSYHMATANAQWWRKTRNWPLRYRTGSSFPPLAIVQHLDRDLASEARSADRAFKEEKTDLEDLITALEILQGLEVHSKNQWRGAGQTTQEALRPYKQLAGDMLPLVRADLDWLHGQLGR